MRVRYGVSVVVLVLLTVCGSASAIDLVDNMTGPEYGYLYATHGQWFAAGFHTDDEAYVFESATLRLSPGQFPYATVAFVQVFIVGEDGWPGEKVADLVNPSLPANVKGNYVFHADPPFALHSNTTYFVCAGSQVPPPGTADQRALVYLTASANVGQVALWNNVYYSVTQSSSWGIFYADRAPCIKIQADVAIPVAPTTWGGIKALYE